MKKFNILAILILAGCATPVYTAPYEFDTAAYAKAQGWCGKRVAAPGVSYDANCQARVER